MFLSNQTFRSFHKDRDLVAVRRDGFDIRSIQGFVLCFSDALVLLQYVYDFRLDGHLLLRRRDITRMESGATDQLQRRMLDAEGVLSQIDFDYSAPIRSYKTFLESLQPNQIVILEDEISDDPELLIGTINAVNDDTATVNYFSGAGNWDESPVEIPLSRITSCQTNTNYINFYARHFERTARHAAKMP